MSVSERVQAAAALLAVMAHPGRLAVLTLLAEHDTLTVSQLQDALDLEQSALSHQLRVLRDASLVTSEPQGRHRLYRLTDHHVAHIVRDALAHAAEDPT